MGFLYFSNYFSSNNYSNKAVDPTPESYRFPPSVTTDVRYKKIFMSRSYHVTHKQLKKERIENKLCGVDHISQMTELEEKDIKKRIAKADTKIQRQSLQED